MKYCLLNTNLHLLVAIPLYFFAPKEYSIFYCTCLCILFFLIAYKSVIIEFKTKRYFSFNLIFMLSIFICTFIIPLFLKPTGYSVFTGYDDYINSCTALVVMACGIYNKGWEYGCHKAIKKYPNLNVEDFGIVTIPHRVVRFLNFISVLSVAYYAFTFRQTLAVNLDSADLGESSFTTILQTILTLSLIVNVKANHSIQKSFIDFLRLNRTILLCFITAILLPIIIGDRTMPIYLLTVVAASYILLYKRIRLAYLGCSILFAAILMFTIGRTRYADNSFKNVGASGALNTISETINQPIVIEETFIDFLPASMSLYLFQNWRDANNGDLFYPSKIFILPFSPIPYAPSSLTKLFYDKDSWNDVLSGTLSADWYRVKVHNLTGGIGTHAVGDIYISWGLLGVVVVFFIFGFIIAKGQMLCTKSILWSIVYITYCGQAMYIARGTIYICYRHIITQIVLLFIVCMLCGYKLATQEK